MNHSIAIQHYPIVQAMKLQSTASAEALDLLSASSLIACLLYQQPIIDELRLCGREIELTLFQYKYDEYYNDLPLRHAPYLLTDITKSAVQTYMSDIGHALKAYSAEDLDRTCTPHDIPTMPGDSLDLQRLFAKTPHHIVKRFVPHFNTSLYTPSSMTITHALGGRATYSSLDPSTSPLLRTTR
ncbi:hypothetical protein PIIN_11435 [Serendipita indica DSM 11827]|uniref:Uncharacterized protein n=1 Tax=Serendipita indica (strain DSM 11827) TaxID=1109443 RepID=G4U1L5_SERID|nr:hypothetical protein PIIN_11435 [Serendipita indica DSM 11827]